MDCIKDCEANYGNPAIARVDSHSERLFRDIVELANDSFGAGYMSTEKLRSMFGDRTSLFAATESDTLCGYALNYITGFNEAAEHMRLPPHIKADIEIDTNQICYVKSEAVAPKYRGSLLAEQLCVAALEDSRKLGAGSAIGSAWKIGDKVPMDHIFRKIGFEKIIEIPNLWYDDTDYTCTICNGRCTCIAVIYFLKFKGGPII